MASLKIQTGPVALAKTDSTAILALPGRKLTKSGIELDRSLRKKISNTLEAEVFRILPGTFTSIYTGAHPKRVFIASLPGRDSRLRELREAAFLAIRTLRGSRSVSLAFDPDSDAEVQAIGEGALLAAYEFKRFKTRTDQKRSIGSISICCKERNKKPVERATIFAGATNFVRDLVNEPPNELNPLRFVDISRELARTHSLKLKIFDSPQLEKMGANAFLSVGKGSTVQGHMIHLAYNPTSKAKAHVILIGKGITFDSGGLSLKTEKGMEHMKTDMSGAATVLACVRAAKELALPVRVTGIVLATENMPDAAANRPGDVVKAMNGKTIEITNTDAEGRLALADGLTYAETLSPDYIIDIATLTGAQAVALGRLIGAAMGNDRKFVEQLCAAGETSGELLCPLPLLEHYRALIKSDIADIRNSSGIPEAGSIQAGLFLSEFVERSRWAHLDIAGPAWQEREWSTFSRNATGFSARCILTFLSEL